MKSASRHFDILKALCDLPTAPYCEEHVVRWLLDWARQHARAITPRRDPIGNVYLEYKRGRAARPLVIEAHMDHPGFVALRQSRDGRIDAHFRGGVKPSHFAGACMKWWLPDTTNAGIEPSQPAGRWVPARVASVKPIRGQRFLGVRCRPIKTKIPPGTLGMWDLPDAARAGRGKAKNQLFAARVCDDLAGVAAIVCLLEELIEKKIPGHVIGLCSRAEEIGFAGVLAVCENGWIPKNAAVIGLETSKASAPGGGAPQGSGPVIRVGDRTGLFSPGLTHFLTQAAGHLADDDSSFLYQRKLMDGGTCNSTAFAAWGYDASGICLALGNYHNMTIKNEIGWRDAPTAGKGIASETIHLQDFTAMVRILVEAVKRFPTYEPGFGAVRKRFAKMHRDEQKKLLWSTRTRVLP